MKKYQFEFMLLLAFSCQLFRPVKVSAQATSTDQTALLKPFVGKYQFTENKMVFLQIMVKENQLVLKQLWDNEEIPFDKISELEFYNGDHDFPLKFTKSSTGEITKVLALNRDVWNRVADDYTVPLKKIIQLTAEQLKPFEGKYELKGGDGDEDDIVQVSSADGHLVIKHGGNLNSIFAASATDFVTEQQTFTVNFTKAADGTVTQAVVNNRDVLIKAK